MTDSHVCFMFQEQNSAHPFTIFHLFFKKKNILAAFCGVFFDAKCHVKIFVFSFFLMILVCDFLGRLVFIMFQVSVSVLSGSLFSSRKDFKSDWVGWLRCWVPGSLGGWLSCFGSGSWVGVLGIFSRF